MKITKQQLRRIIREAKARLEAMPESYGAPVGPAADAELTHGLIQAINRGRASADIGVSSSDEVYIMTGELEGITVRVVRRGR